MSARRAPAAFAAVLGVAACLLAAIPAAAVEPKEMLADPALEARARDLSRGLRCLVCQNESIDESNADLAKDLRRLVRERLAAGDTDRQVTDYVVSRYGDFVLLKPPVKPSTLALWLGPPVILAAATAALVAYYRRRRTAADGARQGDVPPPPLTAEEEARLARLLGEDAPR